MPWNDHDEDADRDAAIRWARELTKRHDWLVLDTETTGLHGANIVQIGLLAHSPKGPAGEVLLDSLVRPCVPITPGSMRVHGITEARVANAPTLLDLMPSLDTIFGPDQILPGREVVIYNAEYDTSVLRGHMRHYLPERYVSTWFEGIRWTCAMEQYAAFVGDWNSYHGNYRFQKLPNSTHGAIGDCRATLKLIYQMAAALTSKEAHGE